MLKAEDEPKKRFSIKSTSDGSSSNNSVLSTMSRFVDYVGKSSNDDNTKKSRKTSDLEMVQIDLPEYERIKTVGRGSFGIAVLYKRLKDDMLVVLKQINLMELTVSEKELAMNEVDVFSKLHHPNIICYFGSFIRGETLLIEMEYADSGTLSREYFYSINLW